MKRIVICLILTAAAVALWLFASRMATDGSEQGYVSVRFKEGISAPDVKEALLNMTDPPQPTLWKQQNDVMATGVNASESVKVTLVTVYGDMFMALPIDTLNGSAEGGAQKNCVIDSKTAYKLFGSKNALGNTVEVGGEKYAISGIAHMKGEVIAVQSQEKAEGFTGMEIAQSGGGLSAQDFVFAAGLPQPSAIIDRSLNAWFLGLVPSVAALIAAMAAPVALYFKARQKWYWLAAAALALALAALIISNVQIPEDFIPSKWSNFEFWAGLAEKTSQSLKQAELTPPSLTDIAVKQNTYLTIALAIASLTCLFGGVIAACGAIKSNHEPIMEREEWMMSSES